MIPIWIWDSKNKAYIALPIPPQQFKNGKWGWTKEQYDNNHELREFCSNHISLIHLVDAIHIHAEPSFFLSWERIELKLKKPKARAKVVVA